MSDKEEMIRSLSGHYVSQVMRAFGGVDPASTAIEVIAKSLNEIYRYFEPSFFKGDFYVCKNFSDNPCFDEAKGKSLLYDKNCLLNRTAGLLIIQVFSDNKKMILWEDQDPNILGNMEDTLTYYFKQNKEYFIAKKQTIDITVYNIGSRFATHFNDLVEALSQYSVERILKSSCKHFADSWADPNRLFFRGGGSGSNIPEKFMQTSLHEFLRTVFRGISMEASREHNVVGDADKPKPVDIRIHWREANRSALIEIKFIGTVKKDSDGEIYDYDSSKVNAGIFQLKGYHDKALSDAPATIIKSHLVVIDGRRKDLTVGQTTINTANGLYYKDVDIIIDADKRYHETISGFEKPIRMFVEPICC